MYWNDFYTLLKLAIGNRTDRDAEIITSLNSGYLDLISPIQIFDELGRKKELLFDFTELDSTQEATTPEETLPNLTGTVAVTNGSTTVTGTGTNWKNRVFAKDKFSTDGGVTTFEISSVASDTSMLLSTAYSGATNNGISYNITGLAHLITPPTRTHFFQSIFNLTDGKLMEQTSLEYILRQGIIARTTPSKWTMDGIMLRIFPMPDVITTLIVKVRLKPVLVTSVNISSTVERPEISTGYHDALLWFSEIRLHHLLGETERANMVWNTMLLPFLRRRMGERQISNQFQRMGYSPHGDWHS